MEETKINQTVSSQPVGKGTIVQKETVTATNGNSGDFTVAKISQLFWFIGHFIAIILLLRFAFLLLAANLTGVVLLVYNLSEIFVIPFRGIFPAARAGQSYFDPAALLGIVMYYLLMFLITRALILFSHNTEA